MKSFKLSILLLVLLAPQAWATLYYVDSSVGSSGNGLAWATAWKNTTNITGLVAGDIVYFSGGTVSKTYAITGSMPLTGGSSGNPVTYAAGQDPSHNGLVIFTATGTWINNPPNWVTIDGQYQGARHIQVASSSGSTETVVAQGKTGIVIKGVIFPHQDSINANGTILNYEIANNELWCNFDHVMSINGPGVVTGFAQAYSFHHNTVFMQQEATTGIGCDGIQNGNGGDVYNNTFSGTSLGCDACFPSGQHQDGIQTDGIYMRIYNNVYSDISNYSVFYELFGNSAGPDYIFNNVIQYTDNRHNTGAQQGIAIGNSGGVNNAQWQNFYVFNNTIINVGFPGAGANCVTMRSASGTGNGFTGTNFAENNMCYGVSGGNIFAAGITLANNIVTSTGAASIFIAYQTPTSTPFAYNLRLLSTATTLIGHGTNQTALGITSLNADADGAPRPSSGAWDIGAFEFPVITASANSCTSGYVGCTFTSTVSSASAINRVVYSIDAYPASTFIPGADSSFPQGPLSSVGASLVAPWTLPWNTINVMNGPHQLVATGYNAQGAAVATSAPVNLTVANTWPASCAPAMTVATGTALTSNWSGPVTVTPTITSCTGDSMNYKWWIDGVQQFSITSSSNSASFPMDTTQFLDGPHIIALSIKDNTTKTTYSGEPTHPNNDALEWSRTVTFANTTTPAELRVSARESFIVNGGTTTLSCTQVAADGSTSSPACEYYSLNPTVCTVNVSTGLVTAVANGNCQVRVMDPLIVGTDLFIHDCSGTCLQSATFPFTQTSVGEVLHVASGTGFTPGFYETNFWNSTNNDLVANTVVGVDSSVNGHFTTGPSRTAWIFVWPDNIMPHFSLVDGTILNSYNAAKSGYHNSMFTSSLGLTDQTYPPASYLGDICNSGFNAIELGVTYNDASVIAGTTFASFTAQQSARVATYEALIPKCPSSPKQVLYHGDGSLFGGGPLASANLWASTRSNLASYATPFVQYTLGSWTKMFWIDTIDEVNGAWPFRPLQGPIQFSQPNSGLTRIVASGGSCTATCTSCAFNSNHTFIITGATSSGFNWVSGTTGPQFTATSITSVGFNFTCGAVANGTYAATTAGGAIANPGLTIEPLVGSGQFFSSNTDYVHSDAFKLIRGWDLANVSPMKMTYPNAAQTNPLSVACWSGNTTACVQNYSGTTSLADYATMYFTHSAYELYLGSRASTFVIIDTVADGANNNQMRQAYGNGFSPDLPILAISQNSPVQYGYQGFSAPVTSMSGGVMTFTSDISAKLPVVYSGISRQTWNGNSYYFLDYNNVTRTAHMLLAKTDFVGTSAAGTIHFANGVTETITSATASGQVNPCSGNTICGDLFFVTSDANLGRNRGQTFTITGATGSGATGMNGNTFVYLPESRAASTTVMYVKEVPGAAFNCASGCAAATVIPDNYFVKGRQGYQSSDLSGTAIYHAGFCFSYVIEDFNVRAVGQRLYKGGLSMQGYGPNGFTGNWTLNSTFDQTVTSNQLFGNPHFENGTGTPCFHAASHASIWAQARAKYLLQPALSSPDYGPLFESIARSGSNGKILVVANMTDGPQTRTLDFTNYLQSGQNFFCDYLLPDGTWSITQFASGTTSSAFTFDSNGTVGCSFPTTFSGSLAQPIITARLADITNATKVVVHYAYDPYWLDTAITNVMDCGTGTCTLPVDRNVGPIWYRLFYLNSAGVVLATSDVQTL